MGGREHHARGHVEACRVECRVTNDEKDERGRLEERQSGWLQGQRVEWRPGVGFVD
jgi:hypothetical protein